VCIYIYIYIYIYISEMCSEFLSDLLREDHLQDRGVYRRTSGT